MTQIAQISGPFLHRAQPAKGYASGNGAAICVICAICG